MILFRVDFAKAIGESTAMLSPIAACFSMLDDETYAIMKQKFDICYSMAKESIPFVKYPALQELETQLGVKLGLAYSTPVTAQYFASYITQMLHAAFVDKLSICSIPPLHQNSTEQSCRYHSGTSKIDRVYIHIFQPVHYSNNMHACMHIMLAHTLCCSVPVYLYAE